MIAPLTNVMELPLLRTAPPIRCQGDTHADQLRSARARIDLTTEKIKEASTAVRQVSRQHNIGDVSHNILQKISDCLQTYEKKWFQNAAHVIAWEVTASVEMDRFNDAPEKANPTPPTWDALRNLSAALTAHAEAIAHLTRAEAVATRKKG